MDKSILGKQATIKDSVHHFQGYAGKILAVVHPGESPVEHIRRIFPGQRMTGYYYSDGFDPTEICWLISISQRRGTQYFVCLPERHIDWDSLEGCGEK